MQIAADSTFLNDVVRNINLVCIHALLRSTDSHIRRTSFFRKNAVHTSVRYISSFEYLLHTGLFSVKEKNTKGRNVFFQSAFADSSSMVFLLANDSVCVVELISLIATSLMKRVLVLENMHSKTGSTPLHTTLLSSDSLSLSHFRCDSSVLLNSEDEQRQTPMHMTAWNQRVDTAHALFEREDIDVNMCDCKGRSSLLSKVDICIEKSPQGNPCEF